MRAFLAVLLIAGAGQAAQALERPSASSALLGSWSVDVSRLPMAPAERPKHVSIAFSDAGDEKWMTRVDIVYADGTENHVSGITALDGTPSLIEGSPEADVGAMKLPAPDVLVMELVKNGVGASTRIYTAAADGRTMTEISAHVDHDGHPVLTTHYFTRDSQPPQRTSMR